VAREAHERDLERRSVRRLRAIVAVLAVAALVAGALTVFAVGQQRNAHAQERNATARELAAASVTNLEVDPERSILLALEAIDVTRSADGTVLPEAEEALHQAVIASRIVVTEQDLGGTLDWSPEGIFVTEGPENTGMIDLRDATTGDSVRSWIGHEDSDVNDVQFSNDGSMLATAGDDGFLKIWDPDTGEEIASVRGTTSAWGQSFDADGRLVAAAWPDEGVVRVAEAATGTIVRTFEGLDTFVVDTALSPDGTRLALASGGADFASVVDIRTGDLLFELPRHTASVFAVSWSPDGRWIATASADSSVRVWDASTGTLQERLVGHTGVVNTVDWSPDSRRIVSGGSDGTARVWELEVHPTRGTVEVEGRQVYVLSAQQTQSGLFAVFSPDGRRVLTGDVVIAAIKIWDLSIQGDAEVINVPTDHQGLVDVAYLPDGRVVASHERGSVAIWDVDGDTTEPSGTLGPAGGSETPVFQVATSPDGERVAMVRDGSSVVSVWNVETGTLAFDHDVGSVITSIDWSGDGQYLAAGTWDDGSLYALDADDGGRQVLVGSEPDPIRAVAFAPDGRTIAAATYNQPDPDASHVSIWDARGREIVQELGVEVSSLAYDGSGERLAMGSYDGTVQIRDASTGDVERSFGAGSVTIMDIVFSPDGRMLATSGEDAAVRLFDLDVETGAQQLVLRGHQLLVSGLDFSPDGKRLASASGDGVVRVWALDIDELIAIANDELTRPLTDDECRQYLHELDGCE
jgi:YD repeat-containing protein